MRTKLNGGPLSGKVMDVPDDLVVLKIAVKIPAKVREVSDYCSPRYTETLYFRRRMLTGGFQFFHESCT